jgi:hypothetical protein
MVGSPVLVPYRDERAGLGWCVRYRYWLSVACLPMVSAWGVYSLLYYPQKSWWSWLINTLANG